MTLIEELILEAQQAAEELVDSMAYDELDEALQVGLSTGRLEAVCPQCCRVMANYRLGQFGATCCGLIIDPEDVIYRAVIQ